VSIICVGHAALDRVFTVDQWPTGSAKIVATRFEESGGGMCTLTKDDFWADDLWQRSVIAARDPALFQIWKNWIRAHQ